MRSRYILQDGDFIEAHFQDCEEIIARNHRGQIDPIRHEMGRPIAEIPNAIALAWYFEENRRDPSFPMIGPRWNDLVRRKLADPEWKHLRCQPEGSPNFTGWRR